MSYASISNNISQYNEVGRVSGVSDADPHRLVQMLLEGALGKIAVVKGLMKRKEIAKKGEVIGQAVSIVGGLRASLDLSTGGELAVNLDNIYEYIERRLLKANMDDDVAILDEASSLLHEIKTGWDAIPLELRKKSTEALSAVS
jgi:flagellar protein FliS